MLSAVLNALLLSILPQFCIVLVMRQLTLLLLSLVCAACAATPTDISGSYTFVPGQNPGVAQAIETAIADMSFLLRPIARNRLAKTTELPKSVLLQVGPSTAHIILGGTDSLELPLNGVPVDWTNPDGELVKVSAHWNGTALVQVYQGKEGKCINTYSQQADGKTLRMDVEVSSTHLPKPVKYQVLFRRC